MSKRLILSLVLSALTAASGLAGAAAQDHAGHAAAPEASVATVKKVDPATGKVTLTHGPLKNLGMPAMTMAFKVKDAAVLAKLKAGDKIRFVAEHVGNEYHATRIEPLK